jgi:hypothetical protein
MPCNGNDATQNGVDYAIELYPYGGKHRFDRQDRWVGIAQSLPQDMRIEEPRTAPIRLVVNLSQRQINHDLVDGILAPALEQYPLLLSLLELEIS